MTCSRMSVDRLHALIDNELSGDEARNVQDHVDTCKDCKNHENELRVLLARLEDLPETAESTRDLWPAIAAQIAQPDAFLSSLSEAIAQRRIKDASCLVRNVIDKIVCLDPLRENAAVLLGYFVLWMETGNAHCPMIPYQSHLALARECLRRFPRSPRPRWEQLYSAHLRMVEGVIAMHAEEYDRAIHHFQFARSLLKEEISDPDLLAFVTGAIGRALTKKGRYGEARTLADEAVETALRAGRREAAAFLSVMKGWIMFQQNKSREATKLLAQAEVVLRETDDHLTLGNIKTAMGRIALRDGRYVESFRLYEIAVGYYEKCDCSVPHPNLARAFANMALLKRLIAERIRNSLDRRPAPDTVLERNADVSGKRQKTLEAIQELRLEASQYLNKALTIYVRDQDYRGRGSVLLISALLHADNFELETAARELERAFQFGLEKEDYILMARARIQQCIVENSISDDPPDSVACHSHAEKAHSFAAEAVELALNTHHNRLIAHSYIWRGMMWLNVHFFDLRKASQCYQSIREVLTPHDTEDCFQEAMGQDYIWEEFQVFERTLEQASQRSSLSVNSDAFDFHSELDR